MSTTTATPPAAAAATKAPAPAATAAAAAAAPAKGAVADENASNTSLYVGDLESSATEAQLYELFSTIGPVVSIRVCRDLITRRSLGYAYVNFSQAQDAARAIDVLNLQVVNGKPIRILYSQRDPTIRKSGVGNIFIKNLDKDIDTVGLRDTFAQFGNIVSAKVATDGQGNSKGYGFIQFDTEAAAKEAIEKVNGMEMNDKVVYVGPFQRRAERGTTETKFNNVFVKNLGEEVTEEELRKVFESHGPVTSVMISKDEDGKSKGFGFVCFETPEDASKAVEELDGKHGEEDKKWVVCRAQKKAEREAELKAKFEAERRERMEKMAGANLYIKNLEDGADDDTLRELFKEFGTITSCRVMRDAAGVSRGSAFVAFSSPEEATRAVTELNGKMVGAKPLYVALAQRKEDRRMRLQAQFAQRSMGPGGMAPMYGMPPPGVPGGGMPGMYYGQPPPGMMPPQPQPGFGFQPGMPGGPRPMPGYNMPGVPNMMRGPGGMGGRGGRGRGQPGMGGRGPQNGRQNFRQQQPMPPMPGQAAPEPPAAESNPIALIVSQLGTATPDQQRMILGEALYPLVDAIDSANAAKVTGMLLEMDQAEVLHLIESADALKAKVQEALAVLAAAE